MRMTKAKAGPLFRSFLVLAMVVAIIGSMSVNKSYASTGTVTLQVGINSYTGGKDVSHMVEQGANAGYYTSGQMPSYYIRDGGPGTTTNALIYFDLAGQIPAGATIDSATLSLYNTGSNAYVGGTVDLYRITDADNKGMWGEGNTSTAFDKTGAGWLRRAGTGDTVTTGWTNTSGSTVMDSVNGTASGNLTFVTGAGWNMSTDIKSDIQAWANGTAVNQGWYMRVRSGTSINMQEIASNQYGTAANRPKLTISYTTGGSSGPTGPTGYTFCANENQTCSFAGSANVAYGANGTFNYLTLTGGTPCTNAVFGDPLVGTAKACYYQTVTTPPPLSSTYLNAIQTYGNFETAGVDIKFKTLISSETAKMFYKKTTDSTYKEGQPFTKYDGNHMATSLFDLAANTTYDVKIQVTGSLGTTDDYTTVKTKPTYTLPTPVRTVNVANQAQLDAAITASLPGDHILLNPAGSYTGIQFSTHSGTADHPILIGSQSSQKPVFSGGADIYHSNFIIITNLELHSISLRGSSYSVILNNYVHDGNSAVGNYDGEVQISHSEESSFPGIGGHLVMNNVISDEVHDAIDESAGIEQSFANLNGRTYSGVKGIYNPGAFTTIRGNTIYGLVDGISPTGDEGSDPAWGPNDPDILLTHPNQNMDVYDNVIYDMQDDGIETDGIVVNARFFRNQIGRSKNAITIAPTYPGPIYIIRNATGGSLENNMKMNTGVAGIVRNVYIFNNTFVQKTSAAGSYGVIYQGEPALTQDIVFKNNIFKALTRVVNGDMYTNGYYHKRHSFDYDLGYSPLTSGTIYKWSTDTTDPLNNSAYTSLAAFKTATGQETHGVWGDPLLKLSALSGYPSYSSLYDMHLNSASSPAINAGVVIPGITNTYTGSAPDIGAYEY